MTTQSNSRETFRIAVRRTAIQFRNNFLRTTLTLLGIVFGVGAVVAMMSIGEGAQRQIVEQIESMGARSVHVISKPVAEAEVTNIVNDSVGLSESDAHAIMKVAKGVESIGFRAVHNVGMSSFKTPSHELLVYGVSRDLMDAQNLRVRSGRAFSDLDHSRGLRVAVVGSQLANREFEGDPIGQKFRLEDAYFTVIGVLTSRQDSNSETEGESSSTFAQSYEDAVILPHNTLFGELAFPKTYGALDMISVQVATTEDTLPTKHVIDKLLVHLHGGIKDYELISPEEILRQKQKTQSLFNAVLIAIAAISLIVGGIGVMNIMLANVMERISEIGLRRAVGARRRDIRNQFLAESVVICFAGGFLGVLLGFIGSYTASVFADLPIAFAWESTLLAFFISLTVGVTFGLMPAVKAANTDPIDALRGN